MAAFSENQYGEMVREQFKDFEGTSELGMLVRPSSQELEELKKAVAIMTKSEKLNAANLNDEQIQKIAEDANIDPANFAIFINGYIIHCRQP